MFDRQSSIDNRQPKIGNRKSPRGFTLIELLVVIAIISLLVSILLPSLNRAKELAKQVVCSSDERQIGLGITMYVNDNAGWLPGPTGTGQIVPSAMHPPSSPEYPGHLESTLSWGYLRKYVGESDDLWLCPSNEEGRNMEFPRGYRVSIYYVRNSAGVVESVSPFGYGEPPSGPIFSYPLRYSEAAELEGGSASAVWILEDIDGWNYGPMLTNLPVHRGGRNVLYLDDHVEWMETLDEFQMP